MSLHSPKSFDRYVLSLKAARGTLAVDPDDGQGTLF